MQDTCSLLEVIDDSASALWGILDYGGTGSLTGIEELPNALQALDTNPVLFSRAAYPSDGVRINYTWDSSTSDPHPPEARYRRSTDMWDSSVWGRYRRCLDANCNSSENISSSVPVVSAYDPYSDTDVVVTVADTDDVNGGQIVVHPGFASVTRLNLGAELNSSNTSMTPSSGKPLFFYSFQTDFTPGVACAPNRSEHAYNCVLAWNDRMRLNGRIMYTYFRVNGSNQIEWQGTAWSRAGTLTASNVSAGYFSDAFWLGWKAWTNPHKVAWTMNQGGGYTAWTSVDTETRASIVDPPSFAYVADDSSIGGTMIWTEAE